MDDAQPAPLVQKRWTPDTARTKSWVEKADGEEQYYIRVPVSSLSEDRDGDEFSEKGLGNLKSQYESGTVGMFLDHGDADLNEARYPTKGILGKWEGAEKEGDVLYANVRLNKANPDHEWLREYVDEGMPVGFSVGFRALDADGDREDGFTFHEVDLVETSAVGIPSNPDGVAAMSAATSEWRKSLDESLNADTDNSTMEDEEKNTDGESTPVAEKLAEVSEGQEEMKSSLSDINEGINKLVELASKEDEEDDEDDEDDEEEEDDDKSTDDVSQKAHSVTVSSDSEESIKALLDAAEDGQVELSDSKTVDVIDADEETEETGGIL